MVIHQEHFGRKFYQDLKTGYWISTTYPRTRAHRWVWEQTTSIKISNRYHVHHIDEDKSNNSFENLKLMHITAHLRHHITEEKKEVFRKRAEKIRPLTKAWHASPEGHAWHKYHALKMGFGKFEPIEKTCEQCSKKYMAKLPSQRFCHNNCKSKNRRASGVDNITVLCKLCQKEFIKDKNSRIVFCGYSCAKKKPKK